MLNNYILCISFMKKVIGLFLVILISTVSVFAQKDQRGKRGGDPTQRCEKMIAELKLDEKQATEFRKINTEFREKVMKERKAVEADRQKMREQMKTLRNDWDEQLKKILTDEQYKQYQEKQNVPQKRKGHKRSN